MEFSTESFPTEQEDNATSAIKQLFEIISKTRIATTIGLTVPAHFGSTNLECFSRYRSY